MTIPVVIWDLIPSDPAIAFLGFVKSENLLSSPEPPGSEVTCLQPSHHSVSKGGEPNFFVSIRINGHICKASIHPESPLSNISSACVERCGLDRLIDNESSNLSLTQEPTELLPRTSQVTIDVGTATLSHKFVVVDSTDATVSLGADFFDAHHAYIDTVRKSLIIDGKEVKFLVQSKHVTDTEINLKRSPDKSLLLPKEGVAQETVTSLANSALEGVETIGTQRGSPNKVTKNSEQHPFDDKFEKDTRYHKTATIKEQHPDTFKKDTRYYKTATNKEQHPDTFKRDPRYYPDTFKKDPRY